MNASSFLNQTYRLEANLSTQTLKVYKNEQFYREYLISSGKKGAGETYGSEQTPRGWHQIRAKIGAHCPENTIFVARRPTGEIYTDELYEQYPGRDWIITRIFWLSGLEPHKNRFGQVDTARRKIYIHGTPDHIILGQPGSRGCIRMRNHDIIELFNEIPVRTPILIQE